MIYSNQSHKLIMYQFPILNSKNDNTLVLNNIYHMMMTYDIFEDELHTSRMTTDISVPPVIHDYMSRYVFSIFDK